LRKQRLGDALDDFARRQPRFSVTGLGSGVFVALKKSPCLAPLSRTVAPISLTGTVPDVTYRLLRLLDPGFPAIPAGIAGGGGTENLLSRTVRVLSPAISLQAAFQEVVTQVPGVTWVVVDDINPRTSLRECLIEWVQDGSAAVTSYDLLSLSKRK
jgi:hypothetical protein